MKKISLIFLFFVLLSPVVLMAEKPLIGINCAYSKGRVLNQYDYVKAIEEAGGIPLLLPDPTSDDVLDRYAELLDGVLFTGGRDIPPEAYGQKLGPKTHVMSKIRFAFDTKFMKKWWKTGKPMMGICLGLQTINVVRGGTMYQDIPSLIGRKVRHSNGERYTNYHPIGIADSSLLANIIGKNSAKVLSRHHQAVDKIGKDLRVIARASDGVVEALQRTDGPFGLFVQFHPEGMHKYPKIRAKIFKAFITACDKANSSSFNRIVK